MRTLLAVLLALLPVAGLAEEEETTAGAAFTRIPIGARAPALGGGIAALDSDPTAALSNPAGLARLEQPFALSLDGATMPYGQSLFFVGLAGWAAAPFSVGMSAMFFSAGDDIEFRRSNTVEPDSIETAFSQLYTLAVGTRLFPVMDVGISGKMILDRAGPVTATGFSADAGITYRPYRRVSVALVAKDVTGAQMRWVTRVADSINASYRVGVAVDLNPVLVVAEGRDLFGGYARYGGGAEIDVGRHVAVRAGMDGTRFACGLGVKAGYGRHATMRLDYAFGQGVLGGSDYEHRFSLNFGYLIYKWPMKRLLFPTQEAGAPVRPDTRPEALFKWPGL